MRHLIALLLIPISFYAQDNEPMVSQRVVHPTCFGSNDGSIELTAALGTGLNDLKFLWNNGSTESKLVGLYGGTYTCKVTNLSGQESLITIHLIRPQPLSIGVSTRHYTGKDELGSVAAYVNGGAGNYTYMWSNGESTREITDLLPGKYTLLVQDKKNCELDIEVEIKNKEDLKVGPDLTKAY